MPRSAEKDIKRREERQHAALPHRLTALYDYIHHSQRVLSDPADIIHVNSKQNILYFVCNIVNILAQRYNIFSFNRRNKLLCQMIHNVMLFFICTVLDLMKFLKLRFKFFRLEIFKYAFQQLGRSAGILRTRRKSIKIICILFLSHFLFLLYVLQKDSFFIL